MPDNDNGMSGMIKASNKPCSFLSYENGTCGSSNAKIGCALCHSVVLHALVLLPERVEEAYFLGLTCDRLSNLHLFV